MKYLLDTNICVFHLQAKYDVPRLIEQAGCENCYISEITVGELLYGTLPIYPVLPSLRIRKPCCVSKES